MVFPLYCLPIIIGINIIVFPLIIWALSVHNGHSEPIFQYLSDLGAIPSEANIFSLVMATEAVLGVIFVFIRYAATKSYIYFNNNNITDNNQGQLKSLNKWSLVFGITLVWGLIGIASFRSGREGMVVLAFHIFHTGLAFQSILLDMYIQSNVAFAMSRKGTGIFRRMLFVLAIISCIVMVVALIWCVFVMSGDYMDFMDVNKRINWKSYEPGYLPHVISALGEWVAIFMAAPYFWSFISEFRQYSVPKDFGTYRKELQTDV